MEAELSLGEMSDIRQSAAKRRAISGGISSFARGVDLLSPLLRYSANRNATRRRASFIMRMLKLDKCFAKRGLAVYACCMAANTAFMAMA
jgi:hypothetical protein